MHSKRGEANTSKTYVECLKTSILTHCSNIDVTQQQNTSADFPI